MFNNDPSALFNQLVKEASNQQAASEDQGGSTKTASQNGAQMFDKQFFQKLASDDTEAAEALQEFVANAIEEGHSPEEVEQYIAEAEAEAMDGEEAEGDESSEGGEFEEAQKIAEIMAVEKSIDDELAENELAKVAGIDRETIEQFLIGEAQGEAYFHGRMKTAEIIEKIASQIIPSDEAIIAAIENLREAGLDTSGLESQVEEMSKQASAVDPEESRAAMMAREMAESEQRIIDSLSLMKTAGYDVDDLIKEAAEKKKMSAGKKALIAGGALAAAAGAGAGGLGMYGKRLAGKFDIGLGARGAMAKAGRGIHALGLKTDSDKLKNVGRSLNEKLTGMDLKNIAAHRGKMNKVTNPGRLLGSGQ